MTSAGYVEHDAGRFATTDATGTTFGPDFPVDVRSISGGPVERAPGLRRRGRRGQDRGRDPLGAASAVRPVRRREHSDVPDDPGRRVDRRATRPARSTRAGGRVAELAPGNGAAAALVGIAFPAATVVGYDLAPKPATDLPTNVSLRAVDARALPDEGPFDLVYCLDSLHHMADPVAVLAGVRAALAPRRRGPPGRERLLGRSRPGRCGPHEPDRVHQQRRLLPAGGAPRRGRGAFLRRRHRLGRGDALDRAGFHDVQVRHSETGYALVSGIA